MIDQWLCISYKVHICIACDPLMLIFILLDDGSYHPQGYSALHNPDYEKSVPNLSSCLSLCSVNQSCAAMSYNESTSTCYMSGVPHFLNISGIKPAAYWKKAHPDGYNLTEGRCHFFQFAF